MAVVKVMPVNTKSHLSTLLNYIANENKTLANYLVESMDCQEETAYTDFMAVKNIYGKTDGIVAHQLIQSFEVGEIDYETAHRIGKELASKTLQGYQYTIATHIDKEHIHNHIVFNSVNAETGYKYKGNKTSLEVLRKESDAICEEYNLSVITKKTGLAGIDKTTYELGTQHKSWKVQLVYDIKEATANSASYEEWQTNLTNKGYSINTSNKNTVIKKNGEERGIRLNTLAKQFGIDLTEDNIKNAIAGKPLNKEILKDKQIKTTYKDTEFARYERHSFANKNLSGKRLMKAERSLWSSKSPRTFFVKLLVVGLMNLDDVAVAQKNNIKSYYENKQLKKHTQQTIKLNKRIYGNTSYEFLKKSGGDIVTYYVPSDVLNRMNGIEVFYSGVQWDNGKCSITFKSGNEELVSKHLGIDLKRLNYKFDMLEERKSELKSEYKKIIVRTEFLQYDNLKELENMNVPFNAQYNTNKNAYKVEFLDENLKQVCDIAGLDYLEIRDKYAERENKITYSKMKKQASIYNDKIEYRMWDKNILNELDKNKITYAAFNRGDGKYNVAIHKSELDRISVVDKKIEINDYFEIKGKSI